MASAGPPAAHSKLSGMFPVQSVRLVAGLDRAHPSPRPSPQAEREKGRAGGGCAFDPMACDAASLDRARLRPASVLPRAFAWLHRLLPVSAPPLAGEVQSLLWNYPETREFVAACPQAGRILRPLCRMVGLKPPEWLTLPKRGRKKDTSPRPSPHSGEGEVQQRRATDGAGDCGRRWCGGRTRRGSRSISGKSRRWCWGTSCIRRAMGIARRRRSGTADDDGGRRRITSRRGIGIRGMRGEVCMNCSDIPTIWTGLPGCAGYPATCRRGSSKSRSQSPRMLQRQHRQHDRDAREAPASHQRPASSWSRLSASMPPQVGMVGGTPRPRKDSAASDRMTPATLNEAITISGDGMFGKMVRNMMLHGSRAERARRLDIVLFRVDNGLRARDPRVGDPLANPQHDRSG